MEAPSPIVDTAQLSLRNAHYFFSQHASTDLEPGHFIQVFILYSYFQFLALHPATPQRHRLTGGQTRVEGKPSLLRRARCSHIVGKKQLPYCLAAQGAGLPPLVAWV